MLQRQGFTLIEMLVVLIIIGVVVAIAFPNFTGPTEQARASNVQNNLLAIYSAQRNYYNNGGSYYSSPTSSPNNNDISGINSSLSLNIQDDGAYTYLCSSTSSTCTATRTLPASAVVLTVTLNLPIQLSGSSLNNPSCVPSSSTYSTWCP